MGRETHTRRTCVAPARPVLDSFLAPVMSSMTKDCIPGDGKANGGVDALVYELGCGLAWRYLSCAEMHCPRALVQRRLLQDDAGSGYIERRDRRLCLCRQARASWPGS